MRLYASSEQQAAEFAARAHDYLIANDQAYAGSVAAGQTLRWAFPTRDVMDDQPVGDWYIPVESRCLGAFTEQELARLDTPLPEPM